MAALKQFRSLHLIEKLEQEASDLYVLLDALWTVVQPSIESVKAVFPEYTPHDARHLQRLFALAEELLNHKILEHLTLTERFLLAASIIGHDWGMGVGTSEQRAIIEGGQEEFPDVGPDGEEYSQPLLADERRQLREHELSRNVKFRWNHYLNQLEDLRQLDAWRDYLRNTHPERSAVRIRSYFRRDPSIGKFVALISHGHGRESAVIEDSRLYPTRQLLNGEIINPQALTLYLRLIDLLDIGKGRTPYELWQFVSPGNQQSAAEWKKHLAMEEPRVDGEYIRFSALTQEGTVLADLFNLKQYCEAEMEWQWRLLEESSSSEYRYTFSRMDWKIDAGNDLHKTPVRFEFARGELIHLLSEEVYEGDPYVFLRELIQNAVDATATRRECLKNSTAPLDPQKAAIVVETNTDNSAITVRDVGTGMTAYIIERYLAVAGRSYYRSQDFAKLGITFDPISRFGIGILSCFVVAERIIIQTRTDPNCFNRGSLAASEAWRIEISAGQNGLPLGYWEWKSLDPLSTETGTEVTVIIDQQKLKAQLQGLKPVDRSDKLKVTEYLKTVAGFVEFPIFIHEGDKRTVIVHPSNRNDASLPPAFQSYDIFSTAITYKIEDHINPLNLDFARKYIDVEIVDLKELNIRGIEGTLSYPIPKLPWRVTERSGRDITLTDDTGESVKITGPKFSTGGDEGFMEGFRSEGMCKSAKKFKRAGVYFQGMLVSEIERPKDVGIHGRFTSSFLSFPNLFMNNTKQVESEHRLGPSRRSLRDSSDEWPNQVFIAHSRRVALRARDRLLALSPLERFKDILRTLEQEFVSIEDFASGFEWDEWPVPVLLHGGNCEVRLLRDLKAHNQLVAAPRIIAKIASANLLNQVGYRKRELPPLDNWECEMCVFGIHFDNLPHSIGSYLDKVLKQHFRSSQHGAMAFKPPSLGEDGFLPPLYTSYWTHSTASRRHRNLSSDELIALCTKGMQAPEELNEVDLAHLRSIVPSHLQFRNKPEHLPSIFHKYCLWNENNINVQHPVGNALCRAFCAYIKAHLHSQLSQIDRARIQQVLTNLPISTISQVDARYSDERHAPLNSLDRLNRHLEQLRMTINELTATNALHLPELKVTSDDLLDGAFNFIDSDAFISLSFEGDLFMPEFIGKIGNGKRFGKLLNAHSPWP